GSQAGTAPRMRRKYCRLCRNQFPSVKPNPASHTTDKDANSQSPAALEAAGEFAGLSNAGAARGMFWTGDGRSGSTAAIWDGAGRNAPVAARKIESPIDGTASLAAAISHIRYLIRAGLRLAAVQARAATETTMADCQRWSAMIVQAQLDGSENWCIAFMS